MQGAIAFPKFLSSLFGKAVGSLVAFSSSHRHRIFRLAPVGFLCLGISLALLGRRPFLSLSLSTNPPLSHARPLSPSPNMPYRDDPALHPSSPGGGGPRYSTSADSYGAAAPQDQSYTSHHHNHFYSPPASASVGTFDQYHDANQYNSHSQQQLGTPIHSPNTPYSATFLSSPGASPGYADNASARSRSPRPVSTLMQQLNLDDSRQSMNMARPDSQATFGGGSYYSDKIPGSPGAPGTPMSYGGGGGYVDGQHYSNVSGGEGAYMLPFSASILTLLSFYFCRANHKHTAPFPHVTANTASSATKPAQQQAEQVAKQHDEAA